MALLLVTLRALVQQLSLTLLVAQSCHQDATPVEASAASTDGDTEEYLKLDMSPVCSSTGAMDQRRLPERDTAQESRRTRLQKLETTTAKVVQQTRLKFTADVEAEQEHRGWYDATQDSETETEDEAEGVDEENSTQQGSSPVSMGEASESAQAVQTKAPHDDTLAVVLGQYTKYEKTASEPNATRKMMSAAISKWSLATDKICLTIGHHVQVEREIATKYRSATTTLRDLLAGGRGLGKIAPRLLRQAINQLDKLQRLASTNAGISDVFPDLLLRSTLLELKIYTGKSCDARLRALREFVLTAQDQRNQDLSKARLLQKLVPWFQQSLDVYMLTQEIGIAPRRKKAGLPLPKSPRRLETQ
ncbi:hypothetical protein PHYPSEUDO_003512 [Phytophthora pseudosyringae]|uniref:RXLR effector n=1 Tax=Phytophthora pseudosyringae TaxID=221518 RepID=A0A8T1VQW5_9STRA|nr:hypothetical protein PHYPSEUDO_003512 [Phytophthora pseudosyringae]